jgi:hypothetical protein
MCAMPEQTHLLELEPVQLVGVVVSVLVHVCPTEHTNRFSPACTKAQCVLLSHTKAWWGYVP